LVKKEHARRGQDFQQGRPNVGSTPAASRKSVECLHDLHRISHEICVLTDCKSPVPASRVQVVRHAPLLGKFIPNPGQLEDAA